MIRNLEVCNSIAFLLSLSRLEMLPRHMCYVRSVHFAHYKRFTVICRRRTLIACAKCYLLVSARFSLCNLNWLETLGAAVAESRMWFIGTGRHTDVGFKSEALH